MELFFNLRPSTLKEKFNTEDKIKSGEFLKKIIYALYVGIALSFLFFNYIEGNTEMLLFLLILNIINIWILRKNSSDILNKIKKNKDLKDFKIYEVFCLISLYKGIEYIVKNFYWIFFRGIKNQFFSFILFNLACIVIGIVSLLIAKKSKKSLRDWRLNSIGEKVGLVSIIYILNKIIFWHEYYYREDTLNSIAALYVMISLILSCVVLILKRNNDIGINRKWFLLLIIPYINMAYFLFLILMPSSKNKVVKRPRNKKQESAPYHCDINEILKKGEKLY